MMIKIFYVLILSFLGLCLSLSAQSLETDELSLDQCIEIAMQQNPLIQSSRQQYQASLARISRAKAFPQPYIYYMTDQQSKLFNLKEARESYFGLGKLIEFPFKRNLRGKIASKAANAILQDIDLLKLDLVFQVKQAFYILLLTQEKLKYLKLDLELSQDFLKKAELKYSAGDVAKVEVLRARVEASKAANEVRLSENDVRLAKAMLNFLLARKKYSSIEIKGKLKRPLLGLNLEELVQRALSFRPEVKKINLSLEKENLSKKSAYLSYLPDFDLSVSKHRIQGEQKTWSLILSFPIPLFFWQTKKGEIAETQANINSLKKEEEHLINAITLEAEESYMNAQSASNQIRLFEDEILTQAEEVYDMFLFSYQEGEIGSIELIDARRTLIELRKSYADALYNNAVALAALEKSVGRTFEGEPL